MAQVVHCVEEVWHGGLILRQQPHRRLIRAAKEVRFSSPDVIYFLGV